MEYLAHLHRRFVVKSQVAVSTLYFEPIAVLVLTKMPTSGLCGRRPAQAQATYHSLAYLHYL